MLNCKMLHFLAPTEAQEVALAGENMPKLDWESIRSSPRDGLSTSYRLTKGILDCWTVYRVLTHIGAGIWPFLLSKLFCGTPPLCLKVISRVGGCVGWGGWPLRFLSQPLAF